MTTRQEQIVKLDAELNRVLEETDLEDVNAIVCVMLHRTFATMQMHAVYERDVNGVPFVESEMKDLIIRALNAYLEHNPTPSQPKVN